MTAHKSSIEITINYISNDDYRRIQKRADLNIGGVEEFLLEKFIICFCTACMNDFPIMLKEDAFSLCTPCQPIIGLYNYVHVLYLLMFVRDERTNHTHTLVTQNTGKTITPSCG